MQDDVTLIRLDENIEESRWIKKGNMEIECFDYRGELWPLFEGKKYRVIFELQQLDYVEPEIIRKIETRFENIDNTFAYYLYGYVADNILHVGNFRFNFEEFNDYEQYDDKYIKFLSDRINVTFLKELPD